ncbi:lysophospholipid acyltransferase family protein [Thiomicrorhabdus heinhorstiae]|uniref:L-ornithine N(alpha)-acyltransferase n=1 Tax=Thiomicrorhabdus heinhorstiae TaxID=2748010 RepID=A0ABS0BX53_9GAMM|nr:GNAT family N-acyltransferase [Thiomicrorhabdus heinhorstiae]MBF6057584.1 lysophospholipid acyltransferase family protein [Thiomicrorhabdus heinhorstiae]
MIHIENAIKEKWPTLEQKPVYKMVLKLLKKLLHEDEINDFIEANRHLKGFAFLDHVLDHFDFSYQVNHRDLYHIPSEGRVIIVANHPIGSLDGLALLKLVRSVRPDVRIVASELLSHVDPLKSLFLAVDNFSQRASHKSLFKNMVTALEDEQALIIFPSGEVSRIRPNGVRDGIWKTGFIKLAQKTNAPVLPIYVDAKNSALFYSLSTLYKPLGTLMLVQEMFNKREQRIEFHIGKAIPAKAIAESEVQGKKLANRFRKHLYRLGKPKKLKKKPFLETLETVAHPVDRKALKKELAASELLGETSDGKKIYLFDYDADSAVMHEIGRLRELTFRTVEEGTGKQRDLDAYDALYRHLVLWDENDLEIVGAYRIGECATILEKKGIEGLYTSTLFNLKEDIQPLLKDSLELGRSFVQPKYWGKRSLDYLWFGIGAYLVKNPQVRYMFGPVSLSNAYPQQAKELISGFYLQQFGDHQTLAEGKRPFQLNKASQAIAETEFSGDYQGAYKKLNALLALEGVKVPTLFKQYAELCDDKGCRFIDFSVDPDFNDCIDAFIFVEIDKIKSKKRERYMGQA